MLYRALLRFFAKEKGKYTVTLINRSYLILPRIQNKVVLLVLRTCSSICRTFLITQFVATEALGKNTPADRS